MHGNGSPDRVIGPTGKEGHHPVAVVLIDEAAIFFDGRADPFEVGVDKVEVFLG